MVMIIDILNNIESCLNYVLYLLSCSDEGLTLQTSGPCTTYGDDHKMFNLELSKLHVVPTHLLSCSDEGLAL